MAELKTGDKVVFRTTGEPGFLLGTKKKEMALVRYPTISKNGIEYKIIEIGVEEIENLEEARKRVLVQGLPEAQPVGEPPKGAVN